VVYTLPVIYSIKVYSPSSFYCIFGQINAILVSI